MRTVKPLSEEQKKMVNPLLEGGSFLEGMVHANFDQERLSGLTVTHRGDKCVQADLIEKDSFQYIGVLQISLEANPQITGDSYFAERKQTLDKTIPQYAARAPPSLVYRSRKHNFDTEITEVELGQYGGRVGVCKQVDENREGASYYLIAVGGAQKAAEELKAFIGDQAEAIENWSSSMTNAAFLKSPEYAYTADVAECNVKRMLYAAADAFEIRIPETEYVSVNINPSVCSYPLMAVPDVIQPINTILGVGSKGDIAIHREVIPSSAIRGSDTPLYVLQGPADAIYQFHPGRTQYKQGFPATTGRRTPLPKNIAAIPPIAAENQGEYKKRLERVFFEGANVHPDVLPGSFNHVKTKHDRTFLDALVKLGWDEKQYYDRLVPVCMKISNPYLVRPVGTSSSSLGVPKKSLSTSGAASGAGGPKKDLYDEE